MSLLTAIMLLAAAAVAILVHRRLAWYPLACAVAVFCTTLPALLVFESTGAARTDFMPFTLAVLLACCTLVSAIAGMPFFLWRWHKGISMPRVDLPRGISWTMLGGMLCGTALILVPVMLLRAGQNVVETLIMATLILGVLGTTLSGFGGTIFLAASAIAGGMPERSRKSQFRTGAALAAGIAACIALAPHLVPESWGTRPANRLLALQLNLALLLPATAGWAHGRRRQAGNPAPGMAHGAGDLPGGSKVSATAGPARRQT